MEKIVVLGGGESGCGAAILAQQKGFDVFLSDIGKIKEKYKNVLTHNAIEWEEETHSEERFFKADLIVKSPGIPDTIPLILDLKNASIPIISEIEFAARYTNAIIIGITGSNGKTTTTLLVGHMLKKAGLNVGVAGNVGESFALQVAKESHDIYVLELSSFQLDGIQSFKPNIAILLNITPDHLDRYANKMENYIQSKMRITMNQSSEDYLIYCSDDLNLTTHLNTQAQRLPFSIKENQIKGACLSKDELEININQESFSMNIQQLALQGKHNIYNSMAAAISARILDLNKDLIRESLIDFKNVEHRLERVIKVHGIEFINDSKATNVNSTWYALESMTKNTIWIVGGVDKGNDYTSLIPLIKEKVKAIVCLGENIESIKSAFENLSIEMTFASSMDEAVNQSYSHAKKGDAVLLSPACASFDLFENYEHRGYEFKSSVRSL
ncbi:MAG: UDP-N-acetylmuramoyl-L-alanine--D-glutamate ligase [Flavobacteriales bacterium]|jgi:UDP-N-acetylmuramoylalanine--D-glutamate ligase|nr:UDP-N-acetylmuramoyl-L-alanine--D-glutamate ligase [Flavobacteriales bacterium]